MATFTTNGSPAAGRISGALENGRLRDAEGQWHDRLDDMPLSAIPISPLPGRDGNGDIEITPGQKMLSAMSGSLLTSLIGTFSINYVAKQK
jgi:hypothetical protein